jgi:hypothetical protein
MKEHSLSLRILDIWGFHFAFLGFAERHLASLEQEFSGAIKQADGPVPCAHTFADVASMDEAAVPSLRSIPRHRSGSPSDKFLRSGKQFLASSQDRDVVPLSRRDQPAGLAYVADNCLCYSTKELTLISGDPGESLLPDLVENYLLYLARESGWVQCHGAAWVNGDGQAVVVAGDSGYGKTTALMRAVKANARFLSNDRIFLRVSGSTLQARSYPLAMNIGCGTIRSLGLPYPHRGMSDTTKIRLTPPDVMADFSPQYDKWFDVASLHGGSFDDFENNCFYIADDPTHPRWNTAWQCQPDLDTWKQVREAARLRFTESAPPRQQSEVSP